MATEAPWPALTLAAMRAPWDAAASLLVLTTGPDHLLAYQNPASQRLFGARPLGIPVMQAFPEMSPETQTTLDEVYANGIALSEPRSSPGVLGISGEEIALTFMLAPLAEPGAPCKGVILTAVDITAEIKASRAAEQAALLADLSEQMNSATDANDVLKRMTSRLVPAIADLAAVFVLAAEDQRPTTRYAGPVAATRRSAPPIALALSEELLRNAGPPPQNPPNEQPSPLEQSLAAGHSLLIDIAGGDLAGQSNDATEAWFRAADAHNMAVIPLTLAGQLAGAVVLMSVGSRSPYGAGNLPFLELIATRAGAAVSHLRAFREQRQIALDLQHALLPDVPQQVPELQVAARYLAGSADVEIGGDWWDVHHRGRGCTGVGLGDVAGRGIQAAVVMGQARSAMRAASIAELSPSALLALLDEQLAGLFEAATWLSEALPPRFATAVYAIVDTTAQTLRVANAGHPPLMVRYPDGSTMRAHAAPGPPLGLRLPHYDELVLPFPAGSLLIGFTDGLVETRADGVATGLDRIEDYLRRLPDDLDVEQIADGALDFMGHHIGSDDDIAVVVVRSDRVTADRPSAG
jgi:hypothetical protein